jgi:hypothetical protein
MPEPVAARAEPDDVFPEAGERSRRVEAALPDVLLMGRVGPEVTLDDPAAAVSHR